MLHQEQGVTSEDVLSDTENLVPWTTACVHIIDQGWVVAITTKFLMVEDVQIALEEPPVKPFSPKEAPETNEIYTYIIYIWF